MADDDPFAAAVEQTRKAGLPSSPTPSPSAPTPAPAPVSDDPFAAAVEKTRSGENVATPPAQQGPAPSWSEIPGLAASNLGRVRLETMQALCHKSNQLTG